MLALLLALASVTAGAFPADQHYWNATEPGELMMDSARRWDAEAGSDFVAYQRPFEWDGLYFRQNKVYDLTVGSISSNQFLSYQRLKLHQDLTERLQVRIHWLEARDFDQDRVVLPLELKYQLTPKLAIAGFGRPSMYKEENDVGAAVYFTPNGDHELKVSTLRGDFQRNKRSLDETNRWITAPVAYTLSYTHTPQDTRADYKRFEAHYEANSLRAVNDVPNATLSYHSFSFAGLHTTERGRSLGWRALYDNAYHGSDPTEGVRARKRAFAQTQYAFHMGPHVLRPGLSYLYREFRDDADQEHSTTVIPNVWFELPTRARSYGTATWSLGYDASVFNEQAAQISEDEINHRLNVKSEMRFTKSGVLALLFTFDLDRFGGEGSWEGGCGQFRLEF